MADLGLHKASASLLAVDLSRRGLLELARTPTGRKAVRYTTVSAISIVISQVTLFIAFNVVRVGTAVECQTIATAVATGPSYALNRYWAWGRRGRSHLLKEVLPFWLVAFASFAVALYAVSLGASLGRHLQLSHSGIGLLVQAASLGSYGLMWIGKFLIFNRLLFIDRSGPGADPDDDDPAGDGTRGDAGGHGMLGPGTGGPEPAVAVPVRGLTEPTG